MCNAAALTLRVYNTGKAPYWLARKLGPLLQKDNAQVSFWRTREVPYSGTVHTYIRRRRVACGVDGSDWMGWGRLGAGAWAEHEAACSRAACAADLLEADARLDVAISGFHLTGEAGGHASAHGKDYAQVSFWRTREVPYSGTVQTYIRRRRDACGDDGSDSKGWWTMGARAWAEHEAACSRAACAADLLETDARLYVAISGFHLTGEAGGHASAHGGHTFARGAHEEVPYSGTVQTYIRRRRDACGDDGSDSKGWWTMGARAWAEHEAACSRAACAADLLETDARLYVAISGFHLTGEAGGHASAHGGHTFARGAHEPTPTPDFILQTYIRRRRDACGVDGSDSKGWWTMGARAWAEHEAACSRAACAADLLEADARLDVAISGFHLTGEAGGHASAHGGHTFARGAHEPTPTPYFILSDLLGRLGLDSGAHVLDVGCGAGRVFAYAAATESPCRVTGVEVDAALSDRAAAWTRGNDRFRVLNASALDIPLSGYTHFYLFNPFDSDVLVRFLDAIEGRVRRRVVLIHMSDNGEWLAYLGRAGWRRAGEGEYHMHPSPGGGEFPASSTCPTTGNGSRTSAGRGGVERGRANITCTHPPGAGNSRCSDARSITLSGDTIHWGRPGRAPLWYKRGRRSSAIAIK